MKTYFVRIKEKSSSQIYRKIFKMDFELKKRKLNEAGDILKFY